MQPNQPGGNAGDSQQSTPRVIRAQPGEHNVPDIPVTEPPPGSLGAQDKQGTLMA